MKKTGPESITSFSPLEGEDLFNEFIDTVNLCKKFQILTLLNHEIKKSNKQ